MSRTTGPVELDVPLSAMGQRVDQYLAGKFPELSRAYLQTLIDEGEVRVDGAVCRRSQRLKPGELIELVIPPPRPSEVLAQDIPLHIVYEDEDLALVNKPTGMVVHPTTHDLDGTLVNALLFHFGSLSAINGIERPGMVHRIDKDTSGLLVIAKNDVAHHHLSEQFRAHSIERTYVMLCWGCPVPASGTVEGLIGRDPRDRRKQSGRVTRGKHAVTHYSTLEELGRVALMQCQLETGRTHQIRVHLSEMHHPLIGDYVYGGTKKHWLPSEPKLRALLAPIKGQLLHATSLGFIHPRTDEFVQFRVDPEPEFMTVLSALRERVGIAPDAPGPWTAPA
ncbi:MAG: RluA family pseudouridine synthase [Deltaproteobacteria bacterium]|nr:RluA family pseudouridine synthase [Deltaproteobacteria bacterium]